MQLWVQMGLAKVRLAQVLAGRDMFEVDEGEVMYKGRNLVRNVY
jgi:Fe-S cluster assembly ATPase SufC